jgi:hypothetical protein
VTLNSTATGNWVEFTLPNVPAGTYSVKLGYKTNANRGILNLTVDGVQVGASLDQYAATSSYPNTTFGNVTLSSGNHALRLTVAGKNSASSSFTLSADTITLTSSMAKVSSPSLSPAGGTYSSPISVTITEATPGATLHYSTDGGPYSVYTGPLTVSNTTTIRIYASAPGMLDSDIVTVTYTIGTVPSTISLEAESLARTTSGVTATTDSDAAASGGARVTLNATTTGSWLELTLPNVPAGTYSVQLTYKTNNNRGTMTTKVDGTTVGGTVDQYASSASYPTATLGTVTFSSTGNHALRLTVAGKNSASSSYTLSADKITLVGQ